MPGKASWSSRLRRTTSKGACVVNSRDRAARLDFEWLQAEKSKTRKQPRVAVKQPGSCRRLPPIGNNTLTEVNFQNSLFYCEILFLQATDPEDISIPHHKSLSIQPTDRGCILLMHVTSNRNMPAIGPSSFFFFFFGTFFFLFISSLLVDRLKICL